MVIPVASSEEAFTGSLNVRMRRLSLMFRAKLMSSGLTMSAPKNLTMKPGCWSITGSIGLPTMSDTKSEVNFM